MKQFIQWHHDVFGEKVVKALEKNNKLYDYMMNRQVAPLELCFGNSIFSINSKSQWD